MGLEINYLFATPDRRTVYDNQLNTKYIIVVIHPCDGSWCRISIIQRQTYVVFAGQLLLQLNLKPIKVLKHTLFVHGYGHTYKAINIHFIIIFSTILLIIIYRCKTDIILLGNTAMNSFIFLEKLFICLVVVCFISSRHITSSETVFFFTEES